MCRVSFKTDVRPGLAAVGRLVGAVTPGDAVAQLRLAGSDVERDRHGPDGADVDLAVGDGEPVLAGVLRLPDAARGVAVEEDVPVGRMHRHRAAADSHVGSDATPLQRADIRILRRESARAGHREEDSNRDEQSGGHRFLLVRLSTSKES